jgi:hypothetical protein
MVRASQGQPFGQEQPSHPVRGAGRDQRPHTREPNRHREEPDRSTDATAQTEDQSEDVQRDGHAE